MVTEAGYESLGFQRVQYPTDRTLLRAYVERLCGNKGPGGAPAVKVDALFGRSPALVCASAHAGLLEAGS
ncbi:MAG TPA: hypothetical protein VFY39_11860 [Gammaproteobacteria bacterium]|nr:hypothetical protein [Gammaproteobacteria bacterium]